MPRCPAERAQIVGDWRLEGLQYRANRSVALGDEIARGLAAVPQALIQRMAREPVTRCQRSAQRGIQLSYRRPSWRRLQQVAPHHPIVIIELAVVLASEQPRRSGLVGNPALDQRFPCPPRREVMQ